MIVPVAGSRLSRGATLVATVFASCAVLNTFRWVRRTLHPATRVGRATLWAGELSVLFLAMGCIDGAASGSSFFGWAIFFAILFVIGAKWLSFRWLWPRLMWRLRRRLIVTYIFIGVIPIVLLLAMAALATYLFAGQFATYVALSNLRSALSHLEAENHGLAAQLAALDRSGKLNRQTARQLAAAASESDPRRTVTLWQGQSGIVLAPAGASPEGDPIPLPAAIPGDFSGFVVDRDGMALRAMKRWNAGRLTVAVISSVAVTPEVLQTAIARLGTGVLIPPGADGDVQIPPPAEAGPDAGQIVSGGSVPPPYSRFDPQFTSYTLFPAVDWGTGKSQTGTIAIATRPSVLYATLFATLGDRFTRLLRYVMIGIAIFFGLIELVALWIGSRLSRSMTLAVAELYQATERVNRGDLTHRIPVRDRDQMAALEQSFNSMTESLARLLAEQKEKQRLESELAIGREVQESLFPHAFSGIPSLEVYGVCRPARSVSGDYYDFIPLGAGKLVVAVGDISGKGISAALLMATVHAFVRAYSLEPDKIAAPLTTSAGGVSQRDPGMYFRGDGITQSQLTPAMLMTTLNYQLFRSTPAAKYATMFLGCYEAAARQMTYCNAGHLPPIVVTAGGRVSRCEVSGTVVGLFDGETYGESTVPMQPGDIFVAFTDGVTEPERGSEEFGEERLIELVQQHRGEPLGSIGEAIVNAVAEWIGDAEQPDDVTVVLARAVGEG